MPLVCGVKIMEVEHDEPSVTHTTAIINCKGIRSLDKELIIKAS